MSNALPPIGSPRQSTPRRHVSHSAHRCGARMLQRLASPPQRLIAVPVREFTLGPAVPTPRNDPPYDPLMDPHLAPFWARRSMSSDVAAKQKARAAALRKEQDALAALHKQRVHDRRVRELEALASRKYPSDRNGSALGSAKGQPQSTKDAAGNCSSSQQVGHQTSTTPPHAAPTTVPPQAPTPHDEGASPVDAVPGVEEAA